ncbi:DNA polymerase III subunit delta [Oceanobacillus iheyensis]|uniref:DNA polymerase III subunit delta n=1 Tax=Oceanobacillus iheyensis TaxID=182710 RepID=UPI00363B8BFF
MSITNIVNDIKKSVQPVYLAFGTESYFLEELKQALIKQVLNGDTSNLSLYDLNEMPIQEVLTDAETFPFFEEKKLIIATNASFLKARPDKLSFEHNTSYLEDYVQNPPDYTVLLIIAPYEKLDERKKITKQLKNNSQLVDCQEIKEQDARKWLESIISKNNITMDAKAKDMLEAEVATNIQLLQSEIEKMALYVGEGGHVSEEDAQRLISHTPTSTSLAMVDAVMHGEIQRAMRIYKDLEKMNEDPIAMIGLLSYQFRMILRVKLMKQKGYTQFQMQKQIGAHPYVIKIAMSREKKISQDKLEQIIQRLAETDSVMKQGKMEKSLAFELLLMELIVA